MPFPSTSLAARVERAERDLIAGAARTVVERRPADRAFVIPFAGGAACFAGGGSPLNKVVGVGFGGPVDPGELEAVERSYAERGAPVVVELSTLADPAIGALLTRRGYTLEGCENVLGLALPAAPGAAGSCVAVEPSGEDALAEWTDVVATAFATPDAQGVAVHEEFPRDVLEHAIADMAGAPGFQRFLARLDGVPAGGASLRTADGIAQLCGAATRPALRRRGVQTALLAHRLALAGDAGCDLAVLTTQPGSKSAENAARHGFVTLYARAVLVRAP